MTFEFSFIARSPEAALNRVYVLRRQDAAGALRRVPDEVFSLVEAFVRNMDYSGLVSVHASGTTCAPDAADPSALTIEVRPMAHAEFVEG